MFWLWLGIAAVTTGLVGFVWIASEALKIEAEADRHIEEMEG